MRIGSLFSGAGGLDMAVEEVFGGETVWHCEVDAAASKVLEYRWPGVPNLGDITTVDWTQVEPVDVLCGGWPCQPFSLAGKRKGAEDERALWPYVARAVRVVRPRYVVLENVPAVLGPEFQRVANDLATLRYDIRWTCLRASDVGAPHRRERLFVVATDTDRVGRRDAELDRHEEQSGFPPPQRPDVGRRARAAGVELLPTPAAARSGRNQSPSPGAAIRPSLDMIGDLLPTPTSRDHKGRNQRSDETCLTGALLPTPNASDGNGGKAGRHSGGVRPSGAKRSIPLTDIPHLVPGDRWGKYGPAVWRWESLTRPAPSPTEPPNRNGKPRLNPAFSEWMMGWPAGWVTQVPGISRNDQLRIIGNGVVPQCAAAALTWLLSLEVAA